MKKSFIVYVSTMTVVVVLLSALSIWGCIGVQHWLIPVRDQVMLEIYTETPDGVTKSETLIRANGERQDAPHLFVQSDGEPIPHAPVVGYGIVPVASPGFLSPKRLLLYNTMSVCIVALPVLFVVAGIVCCGIRFYNRKLKNPLAMLFDGAARIADSDLDFALQCDQDDEIGRLCRAFEKMRGSLVESQRTTWALMEERRQLNASVAHDIRTPITIIQGYTDYLSRSYRNGKHDEAATARAIQNLSASAARLEQYVNSVRDVQNMDDIPVQRSRVLLSALLSKCAADMTLIADRAGKALTVETSIPPALYGFADAAVLSRILENVTTNAVRYANKQMWLRFAVQDNLLMMEMQDDGPGFSGTALTSATSPFYRESDAQAHMGLGLVICKTLCRKHGGDIRLHNAPGGGAVVRCSISIKES